MQGFKLTGHDNGTFAFGKGIERCSNCKMLLDKWRASLAGVRVRRLRNRDISATYDGLLVVSQRFVDSCRAARMSGLVLRQLPDDPAFHHISSDVVVALDTTWRGVQMGNLCPACRQYEWVVVAGPLYIKSGEVIPENGFAQSDIEVASGDGKHPLLMCGASAAETLKRAGLRGLEMRPVDYQP